VTLDTSFGYTGEQTDLTGLQYLRARYYDPGAGRFLTRDSFAGYADLPQSQNPYAYALNNPIRYTDPSGRSSLSSGNPFIDYASNALTNFTAQLAQGFGNWPCIQWDQLLMEGGAQLIAWMMQATAFWTTSSYYLNDYMRGAILQLFDDEALGLFSLTSGVNLDYVDNPAFQEGRKLGHAIVLTQAVIETIMGVLILAGTLPTLGMTLVATPICVFGTEGICVAVAVPVLTGEVGLAAVGAGLTIHGGLILLRAATDGGGGGYNSGTYNNYRNRPSSEVRRAINGYEKQVAIHQDKIANPEKYVSNWNQLSPERQQFYIQGWYDDIARNKDLADVMRSILIERGEIP